MLPEDWRPYGVDANRAALDDYPRYLHEQGLTEQRHTVKDIFVPELLGT